MKYYSKNTPIGFITIFEDNGKITALEFCRRADGEESTLIKKAFEELEAYFRGELKNFHIPLSPQGTDFQIEVWNALIQIPYGETKSYKEIAEMIDNPKAMRAVGNANNKNPIPIFIPCHRVIGANGSLIGYAGGLDIKKKLLELEARASQ